MSCRCSRSLGLGFAIYTVIQGPQEPLPASKPFVAPPSRRRRAEIDRRRGARRGEAGEHPDRGEHPGRGRRGLYVKVHDQVKKGDAALQDRRPRPAGRAEGPRGQPRRGARPSSRGSRPPRRPRTSPRPRPPSRRPRPSSTTPRPPSAGPSGSTTGRWARNSDYDKDRYAFDAAKAVARPRRGRPEADQGHLGEGHPGQPRARSRRPRACSRAPRSTSIACTVRALADGEVLQVNVRPGQFAAIGLERAADRPRRREDAARPRRHRRERRPAVQRSMPRPSPRSRGGPAYRLPARSSSRSSPTSSPRRA